MRVDRFKFLECGGLCGIAAGVALALGAPVALAQWDDAPPPVAAEPAPPRPPAVEPARPPATEVVAPPPSVAGAHEVTTNPGEHAVNLSDRVRSVQPKSFLMEHRLSVSLDGEASLNDAFFQKWGGGLQIAYALSEPFALVAHYDLLGDQETSNALIAQQVLTSVLYPTPLRGFGGLDLAWTPIYGKLAFFNAIAHFDLYLLVGLDAAQGARGLLPAGDVGLGERIFLTEWFSAGLEARYLLYFDSASGGPSALQRSLLGSAVVTLWFPLHGEKEAE